MFLLKNKKKVFITVFWEKNYKFLNKISLLTPYPQKHFITDLKKNNLLLFEKILVYKKNTFICLSFYFKNYLLLFIKQN